LDEENKNLINNQTIIESEMEKSNTKFQTLLVEVHEKNKKIDELKKSMTALERNIL
jgi:peptidoglycan hydrolase CwlO-like protein